MANSTRSSSSHNAARVSGAILGISVFLAGIVLIGYVFLTARSLFDAPPPTIPLTAIPSTAVPPANAAAAASATAAATPAATSAATILIGQWLAQFLQKLFVLLLMCVAGSVIASKGIDLFFKSLAAPHTTHSEAAAAAAPPPPPAP